MVQNFRGQFPIRLVSFGGTNADVSDRIARIVRGLDSVSKPILQKLEAIAPRTVRQE